MTKPRRFDLYGSYGGGFFCIRVLVEESSSVEWCLWRMVLVEEGSSRCCDNSSVARRSSVRDNVDGDDSRCFNAQRVIN